MRSIHLSHINLVWRVWELSGRPGRGEDLDARSDGWQRFAAKVIVMHLRDSADAVASGNAEPEKLAGNDLWVGLKSYEVVPTKFVEWLDSLRTRDDVVNDSIGAPLRPGSDMKRNESTARL
jgi:hypothetical protein